MINLLHLDDDALFQHRCANAFRKSTHVAHIQYTSTSTYDDFLKAFDSLRPSAVLLDLSFGGNTFSGLQVLRELRARGFAGVVVMMSSLSTSEVIIECMRAGASDFLSKGLDESELTFRIARLLQNTPCDLSLCEQGSGYMPLQVSGRVLRDVQQRLLRVHSSVVRTVLVTGESGTGKEMVAQILRSLLPQGTPFVAVNCAALAPALLEAELFGYEKGAFTGAMQAKIGLYEAADGGWLFLDEVARLTPSAQAALLRAIEGGEIRPVGSTRTKQVNVRVVAATNEPLEAMSENGTFRADLLMRLRGYEINLPPLRARSSLERQEILESLLSRLNQSLALEAREFRIASSCMSVLADLPWSHGNVRELWQTLQAMSVDALDGVITLAHLPARYLKNDAMHPQSVPAPAQAAHPSRADREQNTTASVSSEKIQAFVQPTFPCHFENMVDDLFEHVFHHLQKSIGEQNPSQRSVAQLLNISRHEATQRMGRMKFSG